MSNFTEIITLIRENLQQPDEANSSWNNIILKIYANEGYFKILKRVKTFTKTFTLNGGSVPEQIEYLLPPEVLNVSDVILDEVLAGEMEHREVERMISLSNVSFFQSSIKSERLYYTRQTTLGLTLGIFPAFKEAGKAIKFFSVSLPPKLVAGTDTPKLKEDLHSLITFYASWRALESDDPARAATFFQMYDRGVEDERFEEQKRFVDYVNHVAED